MRHTNETVRILALESSCDETAAAVVENGRRVLSNVIFSQVDVHALYGGVVPEIASRAHAAHQQPEPVHWRRTFHQQYLPDAGPSVEYSQRYAAQLYGEN